MRIGRIVFCISIVFVLFSHSVYGSEHEIRVGILDYNKVLIESEPGKSAIEKIRGEVKKFEMMMKEKAVEIETAKNQLKIEGPILSQERRTEKQQSLIQSVNALKLFQRKAQSEIKRIQENIYGQIRSEVSEITGEIGKKQDYFLILDDRNTFYVKNSVDLTENVIREYNKKFKKKEQK